MLFDLRYDEGYVVDSMQTVVASIDVGGTFKLGTATFDLAKIESLARFTLDLSLPGTTYRNSWQVWVYPAAEPMELEKGVFITCSLAEAIDALEAGKSVLLSPSQDDLRGLEGKFVQVFWRPVHFPEQPGTIGSLVMLSQDIRLFLSQLFNIQNLWH